MDLEISQVLTQIIAFLITLWILKKFAWKPILQFLKDRRKKIKLEFEALEEEKRDLKKLTTDYDRKMREIDNNSREKMKEAIAKGHEAAEEILEDAHKQSRAMIDKVKEEIKTEIQKSKIELKKDIVEIVVAATEKVIQEKVDTPKQKKLIKEFVDQVEFR